MKYNKVQVADFSFSNKNPFVLIAGLNVLESEDIAKEVIEECLSVCKGLKVPFIFKASFDKANRSSVESYRGPGLHKGLETLSILKSQYGIPIVSDVHSEDQVKLASEVLDIIQVPAFLCRQTDLLLRIAETGLPMNIKKGQFLSPDEVGNLVEKILSFKNENILLCERGTLFGYKNLVVDMLGLSQLKKYGFPVVFDVTHSLQQPGNLGSKTGGRREYALDLAKSAMSLGLAGLFIELHPDPDKAKCDGPCALPLRLLKDYINQIKEVDNLAKSLPTLTIN